MKNLLRFLGTGRSMSLMPLAPVLGATRKRRPVATGQGRHHLLQPAGAPSKADMKIRAIKQTFDKDLFIEATKSPKQPEASRTRPGAINSSIN